MWKYLSAQEDGQAVLGIHTERVYYLEPIFGRPAGSTKGLPYVWRPSRGQCAYHITLDTTEKVLLSQLSGSREIARAKIKKRGREAADELHESWSHYLMIVLDVGQDIEMAELWHRTSRLLTSWEVELLLEFAEPESSWEELTDHEASETA